MTEEKHPDASEFEPRRPPAEIIIEYREVSHGLIRNRKKWDYAKQGADEMRDLIEKFGQNLQCSDPRDRVYSLLSLLSSKGREQLDVTPDYSKSAPELCKLVYDSFHRNSMFDGWHISVRKEFVENLQEMLELSDEERDVLMSQIDFAGIGAEEDNEWEDAEDIEMTV
jgi:hypothetical protein